MAIGPTMSTNALSTPTTRKIKPDKSVTLGLPNVFLVLHADLLHQNLGMTFMNNRIKECIEVI